MLITSLKLAAGALLLGTTLVVASPLVSGNSIADIVAGLEKQGFSPVVDISQDDGVWEVEAFQGNQLLELNVELSTGRVLSQHPDNDDDPRPAKDALPLSQLLKKLSSAGYEQIQEASYEHRSWEVEAFRAGAKYELDVDPLSGKVISERLDR